jgi:dihydroorotase
MKRLWGVVPVLSLILSGALAAQARYDIVIANGRVIDPASGLDAVRHVGIRGDRIAVISSLPLTGATVIEAKGLVVTPGFIDLHSHSIGAGGDQWQVRDGVTTSLELEEGSYPVAEWYAALEGKALVNYGVSAGHIPARIATIAHVQHMVDAYRIRGSGGDATPAWSHRRTTPTERATLDSLLQSGLDAGGLGIGFEINESPGATREEILDLFKLAKRNAVPIFAHLRQMGIDPVSGAMAGVQEVLADAMVTGASLHLVHLGSSGLVYAPTILEMIGAARRAGFDVTTEAYPYTAASTGIQTALFEPGWQERLGIGYGDLEWPPTGERLTESTFQTYRRQGGPVVIHMIPDSTVAFLMSRPEVMVASDAMPLIDGKGHPRGVGTFARVLGKYVREEHALSLPEAIRKMTLLPAERLRRVAPIMARKGRLTVGADADVTIFDPNRVSDRATFAQPEQASAGIPYVIVNGVIVVRDGQLVPGAAPGRPVKRLSPVRPR